MTDQFKQLVDDLCAKVEQGISARVQIVGMESNPNRSILKYHVSSGDGDVCEYLQEIRGESAISSGGLYRMIENVESAIRSMGYNIEIGYDEQSLCLGDQARIVPTEVEVDYEDDSDDVYDLVDPEIVEDDENFSLADLVLGWMSGEERVKVEQIQLQEIEGQKFYSFRAEGDDYTLEAENPNGDASRSLGREIRKACPKVKVQIDKEGNLYVS